MKRYRSLFVLSVAMLVAQPCLAQAKKAAPKRPAAPTLEFPPTLPDGKQTVTDKSDMFLKPGESLREGVTIAKTPPTIDFLFYPGQDYEGKPWSNWGDGIAANGKYYSAIGDHLAIGAKGDGEHGKGSGRVFEYDPDKKSLRLLADTAKVLNMPEGHYAPGKVHSRIDVGNDGWLYYATHRGSASATIDKFHYEGDWIFRTHPESGKTEVVVRGPVPKHCIPNSVLDPERLIFYGGTAAGKDAAEQGIMFFAYDCKNKKLLYAGTDGPARYMIFAKSTGRVYYVPGNSDGPLMRYDPQVGGTPSEVKGSMIGVRAATQETADGFVYTASIGQGKSDAALWSFNTKTEETKNIGTASVGDQGYIASIDVDPTGRYLYYTAGAHGSGDRDNTPVVQYDVKTGKKKVICFLHPFYQDKYGFTLKGTYSTAVNETGDILYITWNVNRGGRAWDCCGLTAIHIPASERQ
jgi:hypothetical protein